MVMYVLLVDPLGPYPIKIVNMSDRNNTILLLAVLDRHSPSVSGGVGSSQNSGGVAFLIE